jgi:hypothetical protein
MRETNPTTVNTSSRLVPIFRFFGLSQEPNRCDSDAYSDSTWEPSTDRPDCGGYNEAFIMQYWASYYPRH